MVVWVHWRRKSAVAIGIFPFVVPFDVGGNLAFKNGITRPAKTLFAFVPSNVPLLLLAASSMNPFSFDSAASQFGGDVKRIGEREMERMAGHCLDVWGWATEEY